MCLKSTDTDVGEGYECGLNLNLLFVSNNPNSQCFQYKKNNTFFNCTGFLNVDGSLSHRKLYLLLYPPTLLAAAAAAAAQQLFNKRGSSGERHFRQQLSD